MQRMLLVDLVDTADQCRINLLQSTTSNSDKSILKEAKERGSKVVLTAWCNKSGAKKTMSLFPLYSDSSVLIPPLPSGSAASEQKTCAAAPGLEAILHECDVSLYMLGDRVLIKN
jgi:hypothetical protein